MKPSIQGCRYRWDVAAKDLYDLSVDMKAAFDRYGDPIDLGNMRDSKGLGMISVVTSVMPAPASWSRKIGHITYDLRSALDHLVHQLYIATNGRPPRGRIERNLVFPICLWKTTPRKRKQGRPEGFDTYSKRVLEGVDPRFVKLISQHQPYRVRAKRLHTLALLESLSNLDKHRDDHVLLFGAKDFHVAAIPVNATIRAVEQLTNLRRPLNVGTRLARVLLIPEGAGQYGVKMKRAGKIEPAFANGLPVMPTLRAIFVEVAHVLKRCADEIGPDAWEPPQGVAAPRRGLRDLLTAQDLNAADRAALDALGA